MKSLRFLITAVAIFLIAAKVSAYDIAVENDDGVLLYYNYIDGGKELELTQPMWWTNGNLSVTDVYEGHLTIPESVTFLGRTRNVTALSDYALYRQGKLRNINLPESIKRIGKYAFKECIILSSIILPSNATLGYAIFSECRSLQHVEFPDNLLEIPSGTFWDCIALTSIDIPVSVKTICSSSFAYCKGLKTIRIPDSVSEIEPYAFQYCSDLEEVYIGSGIKSIGICAFLECRNIKKSEFASIESLCNISFGKIDQKRDYIEYSNPIFYSRHLYIDGEEVNEVNVPTSVTQLINTFPMCSSLKSIYLPYSVEYISERAFIGCGNLERIEVDKNNPCYDSRNNCNAIIKSKTDTLMLGCKNTILSEEMKVSDYSFYGCKGEQLIIPQGFKTSNISSYSFVESIFETVVINSQDVMANIRCADTFGTSVCKYIIGEDITTIGEYAFCGTNRSNSGLIDIDLPKNLSSIGSYAFYNCSNLNAIYIPESVTELEDYTFYGCNTLESIAIPANIKSIGKGALNGTHLMNVFSFIKEPFEIIGISNQYANPTNARVFHQNTFYNATLYVPKGTLEKYRNTEGWKDFVWIEEMDETDVESITDNTNASKVHYNLAGMKLSKPQKGLNIIKEANGMSKKVLFSSGH